MKFIPFCSFPPLCSLLLINQELSETRTILLVDDTDRHTPIPPSLCLSLGSSCWGCCMSRQGASARHHPCSRDSSPGTKLDSYPCSRDSSRSAGRDMYLRSRVSSWGADLDQCMDYVSFQHSGHTATSSCAALHPHPASSRLLWPILGVPWAWPSWWGCSMNGTELSLSAKALTWISRTANPHRILPVTPSLLPTSASRWRL